MNTNVEYVFVMCLMNKICIDQEEREYVEKQLMTKARIIAEVNANNGDNSRYMC